MSKLVVITLFKRTAIQTKSQYFLFVLLQISKLVSGFIKQHVECIFRVEKNYLSVTVAEQMKSSICNLEHYY